MFNLEEITDPSFVKTLQTSELETLASEIRTFLIENLMKTGGHLSSNLGAVEIIIAMHYVFDSPYDKFLFDVGHQAYVHKILTGRAGKFNTLRQLNGLSGYINKQESIHDVFESGHSSTSISAQAGFLLANKLNHTDGRVVTLIGDASISNGVAFEGMNFLATFQEFPSIIILNDNGMGISPTVGQLSKKMKSMQEKNIFNSKNFFEELGFEYIGPFNGNDIGEAIKALQKAKKSTKPIIVHMKTIKGLGYKPAEEDMDGVYHGIDAKREEIDALESYSRIVANEMVKLRGNIDFALINPAMLKGTCEDAFLKAFPDSCYDVGMAEEHAVAMASGMASNDARVIVSMYATFFQRAYDEILNDIARQNLHVVFAIDRAGIIGEDGATHQGIYDVPMLSMMPNVKICMGMNPMETRGLLEYALVGQSNPIAVRYPRMKVYDNGEALMIFDEKWVPLKEGSLGTIITYGPDCERILKLLIENNLDYGLINARFIKPIDTKMIDKIASFDKPVLVYEQVGNRGSLSSLILDYYKEMHYDTRKFYNMAIKGDTIIAHGKYSDVLDAYGLGDKDILDILSKM